MVVAEFAITLPAIVVLLGIVLGSAAVGAQHVQAQDAAADAARLLGRGDTADTALALAGRILPGASINIERGEDLVCVTLRVPARVILSLPIIEVRGRACALDDGLHSDQAR